MNNIIKGPLLFLFVLCVISLQTEGMFGEIDSESEEKISQGGEWQQEQQQNDQEQEYLKQFAIAMTNFKPIESFNFKTQVGEELVFIYWPQNDIVQFRGIFYVSQIENSAQQSGLTLLCEINGQIIKNITNKKIGVYNFEVAPGSEVKLIFKSLQYNLGIYVSYQYNKKHSQSKQEQKKAQNQNNQTPTKAIYNKFKIVSDQMEQQQQILGQIITLSTKHYDSITNNMALFRIRVIVQTLAVLLSGLVCLFFLKKKLESGYQLLI